MPTDVTCSELAALHKRIEDLQKNISRYELAEQKIRAVQSKLDMQIDALTRIHAYSQRAFQTESPAALGALVAEGLVDIFQLEIGAIFVLNPGGEGLTVVGECNLAWECKSIPLPEAWLHRKELWNFATHTAQWESPVPPESPWAIFDLAHAVYMPMFNNDRELEGIILGGISKAAKDFYDFRPSELLSSFMVFSQQMNGIYNNFSALLKACNADKAKSQFMANLSHEMRTPLNAVLGMVHIARQNKDPLRLRDSLEQIELSSRHLLGLINDVLDIAKIEEDKLVLNLEPFNIQTMVDGILASVQVNAQAKQLDLSVHYHGISSCAVVGDAMRLSQVLINLLSNAIKFTPKQGTVRLDIEEILQQEGNTLLKFSVTDNGIGIPTAFLDKVFIPFEQADGSISRKYGGTGLGLTISQRIILAMGGSVWVESREGEGSCFSFSIRFPLAPAAKSDARPGPMGPETGPEARPETGPETRPETGPAEQGENADYAPPDFSPYRILVVDDVEINKEIALALLEDSKAQLESADNGKEAVDMVAASEEGYYDIILMDVQMPVMDGYTATRTIRNLERDDVKQMIIVAMTANVFKEDVQEALRCGMDSHIGKPVDYRLLLDTLSHTLNRRKKTSDTRPALHPAAKPDLRSASAFSQEVSL